MKLDTIQFLLKRKVFILKEYVNFIKKIELCMRNLLVTITNIK